MLKQPQLTITMQGIADLAQVTRPAEKMAELLGCANEN